VSKQVDVSDMFFDHSPSTTCPIAQISQETDSLQAHTVEQILQTKHHQIQHSGNYYCRMQEEAHLQSVQHIFLIFTVRGYASTVYAVIMCLSVCHQWRSQT